MNYELTFSGKAGKSFAYEGTIFEAGSYPDKGVDVSVDDLDEIVRNFSGTVPFNIEHDESPIDRVLEGYGLTQVRRDGSKLWGRVELPACIKPLMDSFFSKGEKLQVSVGLRGDNSIRHLSWTNEPRVTGAELMAAFSTNFSGARNSKADADTIQQMHDLSIALGASCPAPSEEDQPASTKPPATGKAKTDRNGANMSQTLKQRLTSYFSGKPDLAKDAGVTVEEIENLEAGDKPATATAETAKLDPAVEAQLAEFKADSDRMRSAMANTAAEKFADEQIRARKAMPAEKEKIVAAFSNTLMADGNGTIKFSADNSIHEGVHTKTLRELFEARPAHTLFSNTISGEAPADVQEAEREKTRKKIESHTKYGQAKAAQEAK